MVSIDNRQILKIFITSTQIKKEKPLFLLEVPAILERLMVSEWLVSACPIEDFLTGCGIFSCMLSSSLALHCRKMLVDQKVGHASNFISQFLACGADSSHSFNEE